MAKEIMLNGTTIPVTRYENKVAGGRIQLSVYFNVTHEEYHDITTLLYKGSFDVKVPDKGLDFVGAIHKYSTSVTNLYEKGNVGEFYLELVEVAR